jgi:FAD:protein FMN transferase
VHRVRVTRAVAVLAVLAGVAAAQPALERFEGVEPHMGTLAKITVYASDEASARVALRAGFDRIAELDATLSDYRAGSELSRITREAVRRPVPVSEDLFTVLRASQALARATDGAFDITQGPVVRLWREARGAARLPDAAALEEASRRTGHRHMHLDESARTVSFDLEGMALDVGAIGKGYAASEALAAVTRTGVRSALVAVSGDLAFSAAPPGRRGWRVRIHRGDVADPRIPAVLELTHRAVSTSGNAEQHLDADGRRFSHVIDPATRMGLTDDLTVTVIAPHGLDADGLDTAIGVLGEARGLALLESHTAAAGVVVRRTASSVTAQPSARFLALATPPGTASAPPPY